MTLPVASNLRTAATSHSAERARATPRANIARRILAGAAVLGILADLLLRNEPWGIGLGLWMTVLAIVVVLLVRSSERMLSVEGRVWLSLAVIAAAGLAWRDAPMLIALNFLAMLTSLVFLAMCLNGIPVASVGLARVRDLIRTAAGTGFDVATGAVPLVLKDTELHALRGSSHAGSAQRIGKALALTLPVLLIFTVLLTQADPVFDSMIRLPDIEIEAIAPHVVVTGFFAWVTAGWFRRALVVRSESPSAPVTPFPITLRALDVTFLLGALAVLFAVFVVVQIGWLFGGESLVVRTTGLGYAEYARRGFFELTGVAVLLLPTLLVAHALIADDDERTHRIYRRLAFVLVVLLAAIMLSAGARMQLYIRYYGISVDRLYATAFMLWLAFVFGWFVTTMLRSRPRQFAAGLIGSGFVLLLTLNVMNPDAFVARANLARGTAVTPGVAGTDLRYLATLSGDAVPLVVAAVTGSSEALPATRPEERCAAAKTLLDDWSGNRRVQMREHWTSWNRARMRAMDAVRDRETELRQLACL